MIEYDEQKLKELILYIAGKCAEDRYYGATKLNKILFYSDFLAYRMLGKPITGAEYFALENGPAPRRMMPVREEMQMAGELVIQERQFQKRSIALRPPRLELFSAQQIALVNEVIDLLREKDAQEVSDLSHAFLGWQAARAEGQVTGEWATIPYETVFVSNQPMDEFEEDQGLRLAKQYGWVI